jgi:hypothetical protein
MSFCSDSALCSFLAFSLASSCLAFAVNEGSRRVFKNIVCIIIEEQQQKEGEKSTRHEFMMVCLTGPIVSFTSTKLRLISSVCMESQSNAKPCCMQSSVLQIRPSVVSTGGTPTFLINTCKKLYTNQDGF